MFPRAASTTDRWLFPGRLRALRAVLAAWLVLNGLVRLALALYERDVRLLVPWRLAPALGIGALFDLGVATFFLPWLALLLWGWPVRAERGLRVALPALLLPLSLVASFVGAAELVFWNEFTSRFNFIAVDYLVYTNEVIGNVRESYDLGPILAAVAVVGAALWLLVSRSVRRILAAAPGGRAGVGRGVAAWLALGLVTAAALDARLAEHAADGRLNELAGNGYFAFSQAFWRNEIDYDRFYATISPERAAAALARGAAPDGGPGLPPLGREVVANRPERRLDVVLVSVESLSAEFLGAFGDGRGLTPNLDRLAREGLLFTRLYATGTRTVRGLEAIALSMPPTPGHSIVKRPGNDHLFTMS